MIVNLALVLLICSLLNALFFINAKDGWEDESGFHPGKRPA